jgi:very-short-patch-repair endonuclease
LRSTAKAYYRGGWGQHLDQEECDSDRTTFLEARGYRVLRFWNDDVMKNMDAVVCIILEAVESMQEQAAN